MNRPIRIHLLLLSSLWFWSAASAEEIDPFAEPPAAEQKQEDKKTFMTTALFRVDPHAGTDPEGILSDIWPKIDNPTAFNRRFDRALKIWRVDGGYFGAFDAGEWGGALFFAKDKASKWTRIIDTHIQDLQRFEGDTFVASGGLAHGSRSGGAAYLITMLPGGEWQIRMVFSSESGVPRVTGTSMTDPLQKKESKKLIVLGLENPLDRSPFFGIDASGAVHYLGEREKNPTNEGESQK